jgi:cytochrome P450
MSAMPAAAESPPLDPGLPVLGSALALFRDPVSFLLAAHRRHGPIFRVRALHHDYVVLAGPAANEFVHDTGKDHFSSRKFWGPFLAEIEAPNSIVGLEGEDHAAVRRLLAPQMSKGAAEGRLSDLVRIARECLDGVRAGEEIPFVPFAQRLVSRQVGWLLTGRVPTREEHEAVLDYMRTVSVNLSLRRLPRWVLRFAGRRFRDAKRTTFAFARDVVGSANGGDGHEGYVADIHAAAARLPHLFTDGDVRGAGILPFFAGVDTVGQTLAFATYEVLRRPALLARLRVEVDPVFERGGPSRDDLRAMTTLHGIVLETLRLHPTAFGISRTVASPFTFAGCRVERGQDVIVFTTACHFMPEHFPDPERFDPDRHLPPREEHRQPNVFAPFGRGPHACLGASFSLVQLATTLATMVHRYDLALPDPDREYPVTLMPTPSLGPRFTVRVRGTRVPAGVRFGGRPDRPADERWEDVGGVARHADVEGRVGDDDR